MVGPDVDFAHDIAALPDGGYVLAGHTFSQGARGKDAWLLRLDDQGHLLWDKIFGGPADDVLGCIAVLPEGVVLVGGEKGSKAAGQTYPWLLKLDAPGDPWEKTYGGPYDAAAVARSLAGLTFDLSRDAGTSGYGPVLPNRPFLGAPATEGTADGVAKTLKTFR